MKIPKPKKVYKYWYLITYIQCPICGKGSLSRERQHGPRPSWADRHITRDEYDWCQEG